MPAYLFDSSAAVKRYAIESGFRWVFSILRPSAANSVFVARITGAEVVAALARKRKGQHLTADDAAKAIRRFSRHFARRFQKVTITNDIVAAAMLYADKYELRGYDAVQLAVATVLQSE